MGGFMQPHIDLQCELSKLFNGARWKRGYNPDLVFAYIFRKSVMEPIPHKATRPNLCTSRLGYCSTSTTIQKACTRINHIQHLHQRPSDPRWKLELHLRRRSMCLDVSRPSTKHSSRLKRQLKRNGVVW